MYPLDGPGFQSRQSQVVLWSANVQTGSRAHTVSTLNGHGGPFSGAERSELEIYHWIPCSAEVKNGWSCTFTPPCNDNGDDDDGDNNNNNNNARFHVITLVYRGLRSFRACRNVVKCELLVWMFDPSKRTTALRNVAVHSPNDTALQCHIPEDLNSPYSN